ncbi:related to alpha-amylase A precursor [Phialocephala subalpina]|uniref:alpha-amylase n=1 Tax=Phialocephala subalpina TaxID=576137 RepID=A0A1L7WLW7_9HELO|nr:related to alpha-amylase A precursor [Phialocephala subalpina]
MRFNTAALVALASSTVSALSPAQWRSQSIYQVLTDRFARTDGSTTATCNTGDGIYCGGTFQGIINHLDYIQGMGFTAIWISPIVTNLVGNSADGEGYHGYWAQDIYTINSNFGTSSDLVALSAALHARGMYLMVDVVTNHMGYLGCGTCVDYSVFNPFNSQSYYHSFCLIDYNNATSIQVCWEGDNTVSLPDLRTEDSDVLSVWESWITNLVSEYSIDGLRVDSAQQVDQAFFPPFQSAAGVHILGEVFNGDPAYVCPYQNYMSGVLNYPQYFWVTQAFQSTSGSISNLVNGINTMKSDCSDTTLLGAFLENHDNARFPSLTSDVSLAKNAIAFTILSDGSPIIYEGQEQHYSGSGTPYNREAIWLSGYSTTSTFYTWIASLNQIRNQAIYLDASYTTYKAYPIYSDSSTIAMRKGDTNYQIIGVFSNLGSSGSSYTLTLTSAETGFTASQALVEVMSCTAYTTDSSGNLAVAMASGLPRVFYPKAGLVGSGICSAITGSASTTSATSTTSKATTTTTSSCTAATSVAVTFDELVTTVVGQTIEISGSVAALGSWNTASAVSLSASGYTSSNPLWAGTVSFAAGTVIQYKFINVASDGTVTWEADPNHTYTVPSSCATAVTVSSSWQS